MDPLAQATNVAGSLFVMLLTVVYLSVAVATSLERLTPELPLGLRAVRRMFRPSGRAELGSGDILAVVVACLLQLPPVAIIVWPSGLVSVPARLVALGFFVTEAAWFAYLRRYLVPKGR